MDKQATCCCVTSARFLQLSVAPAVMWPQVGAGGGKDERRPRAHATRVARVHTLAPQQAAAAAALFVAARLLQLWPTQPPPPPPPRRSNSSRPMRLGDTCLAGAACKCAAGGQSKLNWLSN